MPTEESDTRYGAFCIATILFVVVAGLGNVFSMRGYSRGRLGPGSFASYCLKRLIPLTILAIIIAGGFYASLPKLSDSDIAISRKWYRVWEVAGTCGESLKNNPEVMKRKESEIADFLLKSLSGEYKRPTSLNANFGSEVRVEDSPFNLTVEKKTDKLLISVYDRIGTPAVLTFPIGNDGPGKSGSEGASDSGAKN